MKQANALNQWSAHQAAEECWKKASSPQLYFDLRAVQSKAAERALAYFLLQNSIIESHSSDVSR